MTIDRDLVVAALPAYEIGEELGRGGWGIVLAGVHKQLRREVAIKQLPRAFAADPSVRARFVAEAQLLALLDHPHVVPVYDFVEHDGLCLLVMEKLSGGTVWSRFTGEGLTMDAACAVVLAACAGLHCAHSRGVLHRDVKPENLMFTTGGVLKVTDFGIAKVIGGGHTLATRAGEVLGTPIYMAPEQARAAELTPATDVYAAGTMLYELLSGRLPFEDDGDTMALLYRHVHEAPIPLTQVAAEVPSSIAEVVMRAIATDPAERYASAEAFGLALAEAATAAWEPGWLGRGGMTLMAASAIVAATERPSKAAVAKEAAATAPPVPAPKPAASARDTERVPAPVERARAASTVVPSTPVRPDTTVRRPQPVIVGDDAGDLVPVDEVLEPPPATPYLVSALALLLLALAMAFAGGSPAYDRRPDLALTVNGIDVSATDDAKLDLSTPVEIAGRVPGGAPPTGRVRLGFSVLGASLGSAGADAQAGADGMFMASVDARGLRYLVAGQVTGRVDVTVENGGSIAHATFPVTSDQSPWLTVPGAVGIALALFVCAYAGSLLRSRRRGRKRVTATVGMIVIGALAGVALAVVAWILAAHEPVTATLVVCALLGAGAGLAASLAAARIGRRRRFKPRGA